LILWFFPSRTAAGIEIAAAVLYDGILALFYSFSNLQNSPNDKKPAALLAVILFQNY
jgi:hypothetical protein